MKCAFKNCEKPAEWRCQGCKRAFCGTDRQLHRKYSTNHGVTYKKAGVVPAAKSDRLQEKPLTYGNHD